ncbi:hypothetical protein PMF13cell1_01475 [Blautia producta]|uniref:Lantibiotic biosynthesis protein dehydration domain-containing protein n=1 Tax=Blautia producta TaxID=33035 RepID=A0A4P6LV81_9FIRM|nr:type 2 lanthipeptide synthetase LanM family protein [Blautia producta]QBE95949.1 hypothetical protein PMF13cell1_01475 [Blautia producta]
MIENQKNSKKYKKLNTINPSLLKLYFNGDYQAVTLNCDRIKNKNFCGFYLIFSKLTWKWINDTYPDSLEWGEQLKGDFIFELVERIEPVAIKCLITEIHYCKENGFLKGCNSSEEYEYFNEWYFQNNSNLKEFFKAYPLLEKTILRIIHAYCNNIITIMSRVKKDRKQISYNFLNKGKVFNSVVSMKQLGDMHLDGNSVFCLLLDNGEKIIYKPHCIKYINVFNDYLNQFYVRQGLETKKIKTLDMGRYGWIEFIIQKACRDKRDVQKYYQRIGINLFLCYLMNNRDLHFENIIAHGEYPILIDLEAFDCDRRKSAGNTADNKAQHLLRNSVLNIGILPFYIENKAGRGVNLSGIEANEQKLPYSLPIIKNNKTSDIRIDYCRPLVQMAKNTPTLNYDHILPGDYTDDIVRGFYEAYSCAMKDAEVLLDGLKNSTNGIVCRCILRGTQQYQMLLNTSYWPELMVNDKKRYMHILNTYDKENMDQNDKQIMLSETESIFNGEIPYFWFTPDDTSLYLAAERKVKNFFSDTVLGQLEKKVKGLSNKDRNQQIRFIKQTMALAKTSELKNDYIFPNILNQMPEYYSEKMLLEAAVHLGDNIIESAIYGDNGDISWIIPRLHMSNEMEWHLDTANMYIYNGIAGISVFFHTLYHLSQYKRFQSIVKSLDKTMENYTNQVYKDRRYLQSELTGAINGEGSIIYAYQIIYQLTKKSKYICLAEKHTEVLIDLVKKCRCPDLISGNAGAILVYINMFNVTNKQKYINYAMNVADTLIMSAIPQEIGGLAWNINEGCALTGFSHGNAGISYAFAKLCRECGLERYKYAIEESIKYENLQFDEKIGNWVDLRKKNSDELDSVSWCHGAAGILISRLEIQELGISSLTEIIKEDINKAAKKILYTPLRKGQCLCHGNCGNIDILIKYLHHNYNPDLDKKLKSFLYKIAHKIYYNQINYLPQEENPGFMNGFAGVGYILLRETYDLPDILAVEI